MLYFSDISREDSFKISHEINFSEKYKCQNEENKNNFKYILFVIWCIMYKNTLLYIYFCVGMLWKINMNLISKCLRNIFVYGVVYIQKY